MRKPDPVELVLIAVPVLIEAVAVILAFACAVAWIAIANTPGPV